MLRPTRRTLSMLGVGLVSLFLLAVPPPAPDLSAYPWLYLRHGQTLDPTEATVSLLAVGDIFLGRGVATTPDPFALTANWLRAADITLGNLESTLLVDPQDAPGGLYHLHSPAAAASRLAAAGLDGLSLANNHTLDAGLGGLLESAEHLRQTGLTPSDVTVPPGPVYFERHGWRLAWLAFNLVPVPEAPQAVTWDDQTGVAAIVAARAQADVVVVSMHWGHEYARQPDAQQHALAQTMQAAGADIILGHHTHTAQPVSITLTADGRAQLAAYSLGNFVFDQDSAETGPGLALKLWLDAAGLRAVQALPVIPGRRPQLLPPAAAADWLTELQPPAHLTFTCTHQTCGPTFDAPDLTTDGIFWGGSADLTGDGQPEIVRRAGSQVSIYQAGQRVWQSPVTWRVVDAALGDPNDDGRSELLLALFQRDGEGIERSQPYLVGYRGGAYTLLWGGRPVADPILEVAVGDIDGDQVQELVVIEERHDGTGQGIGVWRWSGWSFSLVWRSAPGAYHDLHLIPPTSGAAGGFQVTTGAGPG